MDYYRDPKHVVTRLVKEWNQHGKIIIAYDFDNTVYDYHNEGHSYDDVISLLKECKEFGAYLIVFTAKEESEYPEMIHYLNSIELPFDAINENLSITPFKGRKIYYNILLDDRAGLSSAYKDLKEALNKMKYPRLMKEWTENWKQHIENNKLKMLIGEESTYELLKDLEIEKVELASLKRAIIRFCIHFKGENGLRYLLDNKSERLGRNSGYYTLAKNEKDPKPKYYNVGTKMYGIIHSFDWNGLKEAISKLYGKE